MDISKKAIQFKTIAPLIVVFILGLIAMTLIARDLVLKEREREAFRLEAAHEEAKAKIEHSINDFANLVSGIRAYIDVSPEIPDALHLQQFVNDLLEDVNYQDSIIVSFIDTSHTFIYTFSRHQQDPAGLTGLNVADFRDQAEIDKLDLIMQDHDLHIFHPINLVEGWPGIPLNFGIQKEGKPLGYIASVVNFSTIIDPVYATSKDREDIAFRFSMVGGPEFDRETVYDGSEVYNTAQDEEYFGRFDIADDKFLYSDIEKYGSTLRLGTAYKENPGLPDTLTIGLLYTCYLMLFAVLVLLMRQLSSAQKANRTLQEAKQIAERTADAKHSFLVNLSHELRTPLNAIIGFAGLLKDTELNEMQASHANTISVASTNLLHLINDVLDISKVEEESIELEKRPFNVKKVVEDAVTINSQAARAKKLKLISTIDSTIPAMVIGDPVRLTQVLMNLIGNSIKFTEVGKIEISAIALETLEDRVHLEFKVKDTGIGIAEEKQERIFERFAQAESSTTRLYGGTGLGLSICKALVELQGGSIRLKSRVGKGTEFCFVLSYPLAGDSEIVHISDEIEKPLRSLDGTRILLAEDNAHNQVLARTYLTRNGGLVDIAENGKEAVERFRNGTYDCILMDLQMPLMDGFQATRKIRSELGSDIPIIACTAHFLESEKVKSLEVGMNEYLTKPYSEEQLIQLIGVVVNGTARQPEAGEVSPSPISGKAIADVLKTMEEKEGREFVGVMLDIFHKRIPQDINTLKTALATKNVQTVKSTAHLLAGSLGSMQFDQGHQLARKVEMLAGSDTSAFEELHRRTEALITHLTHALEVTRKFNKETPIA